MLSTNFIRKKALQLIKDFNVPKPPVPIRDLVDGHMLQIEEVEREDTYDGELVPERRIIRLNISRPSTRQRFTLAHELGHFVLYHKGRHLEEEQDEENDGPLDEAAIQRLRDAEADKFAAELLMPAPWVKEAWKTYKRNVQQMAAVYQVSDEAMWIRVKELGILNR